MSTTEDVHNQVREGYAAIAREGGPRCGAQASCCCGEGDAAALAQAVGYSEEELAALPDGANLGLSCGNPVALASLRPGETVVDLGSGAGFDVFIAGRRVGAEGRAIGVDMTAEMLARARANTAAYRERAGLDNVEFRLGEIEHLPLADNSADVVISNCVINLSPDKAQVWCEVARVLRPGGRVAISDLALTRPLPASVRGMAEALVGCVAGAVLVEETQGMVERAGLADIRLEVKPGYVEQMTDLNDPLYRRIREALPDGAELSEYIVSLEVNARKPGGCCCSCC